MVLCVSETLLGGHETGLYFAETLPKTCLSGRHKAPELRSSGALDQAAGGLSPAADVHGHDHVHEFFRAQGAKDARSTRR